jgi:DNA (cytosine-5)-methyltransferase 1
MEITVGSLFSGIGGLDLGLERAGMKVIWQSEIDKYCCKILKKHWPEVPNHGNIKEINWQEIQRPNIIAGGYPCQPFSQAGKRKGTQDPRHLWPWVREAISQLRPDYAILENVPGHLTMGGTEVIGALTEIGYDAEWRVVSAAGIGAPHLRKRLIIVAYPNESSRKHSDAKRSARTTLSPRNKVFNSIEPSNCVSRTSKHWVHEPNVGRVADGIPKRVDRLTGLGNAVVPQVAEYIGQLVMEQYK